METENLPAESEISRVFLKPGEVHISKTPAIVRTILGSCVSVTMFAGRLKMGAICHGLLPNCAVRDNCTKTFAECFKYVDCSVWHMIGAFEKQGVPHGHIRVGMYGGSRIFGSDIGKRNIESAKQTIKREGLRLTNFTVGGQTGRRLVFHTHTGYVDVRNAGSFNNTRESGHGACKM